MSDDRQRKAITFELDRLAEYTEDAILAEIHRVASIVQDGPLTVSIFNKHSRVNRSTVTRYFGSWGKALEAAGLTDRWSEQLGSPGAMAAVAHKMSNEEIVRSLQKLASRLGKSELTVADVEANLPFGGGTLRRRWGSARKAFEAAGIALTNHGRRYTDEECFANLLEVWTHYGRPPQYREMGSRPSTVGGKAYVKRFGTWNKALAAFVTRVNAEIDEVGVEFSEAPSRRENPITFQAIEGGNGQPRDAREVPLGLRFRVLSRDRFKCVLCGDSPSANPVCVLHVDHVIPWSKGGRTMAETLCSSCNIGRGNRYTD